MEFSFDNLSEEQKQKKWVDYVIEKNSQLTTETQRRLSGFKNANGDGYVRVGYKTLRDFYDGDQWSYKPEGGGVTRVYNYCFTTVNNYTAFMTNEPVEFDIPSSDPKDDVENMKAELKETLLKKVLSDNNFNDMFEEAVAIGSNLGDTFIIGPFVREKNKKKQIVFNRVKRPETIKLIWVDDLYNEISGFIREYWMAKEVAEALFGDKLKARNINLPSSQISYTDGQARPDQDTSLPMVRFLEYWDDVRMVQVIGDQMLDYEESNHGFIPIQYVKNLIDPNRPYGISDIENMLDPQSEYNEKNFDLSNITTDEANPKIFGKNLKPTTINAGAMELIDLGDDDAELIQDPRRSSVPPLEAVIGNRRNSIFELSGMPEVLTGGGGVKEFSGRALAVFMQPVNNRVKGRQARWTTALKSLCKNVFILLEEHFPQSKQIIGGVYDVDIFFPGTLLRNVTDEINKFNAKVQSQRTTMKNIGVPSPKDEVELMKKELTDTKLMIEISKSPQLQMQLQTPMGQEQGMPEPMMNEDENGVGEAPMANGGAAQQQSPLSPAGRIRQRTQQGGGASQIPNEE